MMDGGLVRGPGRTDRPTAARPEQTRRQPAEPQAAIYEEPSALQRPSAPRRQAPAPKGSLFGRIKLPLIIALIVIVVVVGGWFAWSKMQSGGTPIDESKYQAVFFTNGQVYFGKLTSVNNDYLQLTDIYYLQSQQAQTPTDEKDSKNPQKTSTDDNNVQLIKLGDEIHGPEDQMTISKDQVLFYENLKSNGKVAQSISQFKKK